MFCKPKTPLGTGFQNNQPDFFYKENFAWIVLKFNGARPGTGRWPCNFYWRCQRWGWDLVNFPYDICWWQPDIPQRTPPVFHSIYWYVDSGCVSSINATFVRTQRFHPRYSYNQLGFSPRFHVITLPLSRSMWKPTSLPTMDASALVRQVTSLKIGDRVFWW